LSRIPVKVCGLREPQHVRLACEAGASAVGFVLAQSPRQVTPAHVADLCAHAAPGVYRVAVFRRLDDPQLPADSRNTLASVLATTPITHVQADWADEPIFDDALEGARSTRPATFPPVAFIPVFRDVPTLRVELPNELATSPAPRLILLEGPDSGTGKQPDWQRLRRALDASPHPRVMLAGGLHTANIAAAVQLLAPAMLDVSSGVESAPGHKDPAKITAFIAAAASAFAAHAARTPSASPYPTP
jgi:phosphoribosylanthranilate isomerase